MAIHFLEPERNGLGYMLGGLAGTGLGALGSYVQHKVNAPEKRRGFEALGASPEEAKALADAPESQQNIWLKERMKSAEREKQAQLFSGLISGGMQQPVQQPMVPKGAMESLGALGEPERAVPVEAGQRQPVNVNQVMKERTVEELQQWRENLLRSGGDPKLISDAAALIDKEIDTKLKQKQLASKEKTEAFKITAPFRTELAKQTESNDHLLDTLKEMDTFSESGKMTDSAWLQFMEKLGLDLNILKSPETEAYQALEKEFLQDLKSIFGGRISNLEMQNFLRGIPRATNTPEGRKMISKRLKAVYKAKSLKFKTMREIIKENGGIPPLDLQDQVFERMNSKKLKSLEESYINKFRGIPKGAHLVQNEETGEYGIEMPNGEIRPYNPEGI